MEFVFRLKVNLMIEFQFALIIELEFELTVELEFGRKGTCKRSKTRTRVENYFFDGAHLFEKNYNSGLV